MTENDTHLEIHVVVSADEEALVLHPPLQADDDGLAGLLLQKGFRVHGLEGRHLGRRRWKYCSRSQVGIQGQFRGLAAYGMKQAKGSDGRGGAIAIA